MLGQRQHCRGYRYGRVPGHHHLDVVIVVGVAGRAIDESRLLRADALGCADYRSLGIAALVGRIGPQYLCQRLLHTSDRYADKVQQRLLADLYRSCGNIFEGCCRNACGELCRLVHGLPLYSVTLPQGLRFHQLI